MTAHDSICMWHTGNLHYLQLCISHWAVCRHSICYLSLHFFYGWYIVIHNLFDIVTRQPTLPSLRKYTNMQINLYIWWWGFCIKNNKVQPCIIDLATWLYVYMHAYKTFTDKSMVTNLPSTHLLLCCHSWISHQILLQ